MSEVNARDLRIINNKDDIIDTYEGAGKNAKTGIEVELAFFDPKNMNPMSIPQNKVLKNAALAALPGDWVRNEPSSEMLEVNSIATGSNHLKSVLNDTNTKIKLLNEKAQGIGLKRSYFQELPEKTAADFLQNIMPIDRYQAFFVPPRPDMMGFATYFTICKSNQISVSYKDYDHLLANVRRLYLLAPFLFLLTDNSAAFSAGKKFTGHSGMMYRHNGLLEGRGGVPPYVFTARNGEEFIQNHIDHVFNIPLYVYYDEEGNLHRIPTKEWSSVNKLKEKGLNIASNYHLAETVLWPDVKIAALKDEDGNVNGHRYEARMLGVGAHQHQTSFLITSALAFNPVFAEKIDRLLADYGFDMKDLPEAHKNLDTAYENARNHDGQFFDIAYGTGSMAEFASEFATLIQDAYTGEGFDDELAPLLSICRTGCVDGKVNRLLFPTLEDILKFQREHDPDLLNNPNTCAHMLFKKEIKEIAPAGCSAKII